MGGARELTGMLLFHLVRTADRVTRTSTYLAAGTPRISDLQEDHRRSWERFYMTHPSPDATLMRWEAEVIDQFVHPGTDVLLVGCGSGRDLMPLLDRGCRVTGIDPSRTALTMASGTLQRRGRSATLLTGFFEDIAIPGRFETVMFSYYAYASIAMAQRRRTALAKAADLLKPGGHVIVSHAAGGSRPRDVLARVSRLTSVLTRSDWRIEPGDLVWSDRFDQPWLCYTHIFEDGELESEARAAHLRTVACRVVDGAVVAVFSRE